MSGIYFKGGKLCWFNAQVFKKSDQVDRDILPMCMHCRFMHVKHALLTNFLKYNKPPPTYIFVLEIDFPFLEIQLHSTSVLLTRLMNL